MEIEAIYRYMKTSDVLYVRSLSSGEWSRRSEEDCMAPDGWRVRGKPFPRTGNGFEGPKGMNEQERTKGERKKLWGNGYESLAVKEQLIHGASIGQQTIAGRNDSGLRIPVLSLLSLIASHCWATSCGRCAFPLSLHSFGPPCASASPQTTGVGGKKNNHVLFLESISSQQHTELSRWMEMRIHILLRRSLTNHPLLSGEDPFSIPVVVQLHHHYYYHLHTVTGLVVHTMREDSGTGSYVSLANPVSHYVVVAGRKINMNPQLIHQTCIHSHMIAIHLCIPDSH